jgi:hypothetical protein
MSPARSTCAIKQALDQALHLLEIFAVSAVAIVGPSPPRSPTHTHNTRTPTFEEFKKIAFCHKDDNRTCGEKDDIHTQVNRT